MIDQCSLPLGATPRPGSDPPSTIFRVFSEHARAVDVCLFDRADSVAARRRVALERQQDGVWAGEIEGVGIGQLYGLRVDGPFQPALGHRFNQSKLLVDPYAKAVTGEPRLSSDHLAYRRGAPETTFDGTDNAAAMPKCVVVETEFDWQDDRPPRHPWKETLIYECHVRGMTQLHPEVPEHLKGTFTGLASAPIIEHLQGLGVTAIELLPIHQKASEPALLARDLTNYWGYSPLSFFAPNAGYSTSGDGRQVREFQQMVRAFHAAGIEVILDVVFNHTCEGDRFGPTYSLRGLDNSSYYRLWSSAPSRYQDLTGCGNTLATDQPAVHRLILDSLRFWVEAMHVDGFRFDLATTLGRDRAGSFDTEGLLTTISRDPILEGCKLIAEPWDLGSDGYRLGQFTSADSSWYEWNDRFRDSVRRFWRGDHSSSREFANRFRGSRDLGSVNSIHFVTCHDGFTLTDLVSYSHKHNLANGEDNRDGRADNISSNWGEEGPSDQLEIRSRRLLIRRNFIATTLLAAGVPMLRHGDELGHSQHGNNNAYCQDNAISWLDWSRSDQQTLEADIALLVELRKQWFDAIARGPRWVDSDFSTSIEPQPDHSLLIALWIGEGNTRLVCAFNREPTEEVRLSPPNRFLLRYSSSLGPAPAEDLQASSVRVPPMSLIVLESQLQ